MHKNTKVILLSSAGAALEYYDFIIYGMMSIYITEIFFKNDVLNIAYLKTFSILAVGYLARPLGGYVFGMLADLHGRKTSLVTMMGTMIFATLVIACMPTYEQIGILAPLLLTLARVLQGISFGAEIPNITTIVQEFAVKQTAGKYFGVVIASTSIGALLASAAVAGLSHVFCREEIIAWAWRLPFFLGASLAFIIFLIRSNMQESAIFLQHRHEKQLHESPAKISKSLARHHLPDLLHALCITLFFSYLIIFSLYLPAYASQYFNYKPEKIFAAVTFGIFLTVFLAPFFGNLFNRFNRAKILKLLAVIYLLILSLLLYGLQNKLSWVVSVCIIGYQIIIAAYSANVLYILATIFPPPIRATALGISYNIAYAIASLLPLLLNATMRENNHLVIIMLLATMVVGIASTNRNMVRQ